MIGEEGRSSTGDDDEPWLVLFHGQRQVFYSISNPKQIHRCRIPQFVDSHIIGHSQYGWLILRREIDDTATSFSLLNPVTLETIELPALNNSSGGDRFARGELTCPPSNPNCRVVIANNINPQLAHCKPGDETWSVQNFSEEFAAFYRLAICNQSLYALTLNSQLLEITTNNDNNTTTTNNNSLVASLLVESYPSDMIPRYTERLGYWNLVESGGELLWIILCHRKHSDCELDWVLVHKLDRSSMSWVRVNTLDGRAIFISPNSYSFSCSCSCNNNNGIKPNCIYFFQSNDYQKLLAFDVERGQALQCKCASSSDDDHDDEPLLDVAFINYPAGHRTTPRCSLVGVETSEIDRETVQVEVHNETKRAVKENEEEEEEEEEEALLWKLPREIFTDIAKKLIDCRSFRTCCRKLKSAIPLPPPLYPWFFYFKQYKGDLNFQDLMYGHTHEKQVDESLSGAEVAFSTKCWLVMTMLKPIPNPELDPHIPVRLHVTFYNPFTKEARSVPEMKPYIGPSSFGISAPPTSPECCVIAMWEGLRKDVVFSFMRLEDQRWHFFLRPPDEHEFQPSYHNTPVSLDDKFYFLDKARRLGVFSYGRDDGGEFAWTWDVYDWKLLNIAGEQIEDTCDDDRELEYLVECGGEILAVLVGDFGEFVRVYKFDQERKGWLEEEGLGPHMLFVSRTSCFSRVEEVAGMGNKIYFPRVSTKQQSVIFYSLDTREYQTFDSEDHAMDDFQPSSEVCLSGWIETPLR